MDEEECEIKALVRDTIERLEKMHTKTVRELELFERKDSLTEADREAMAYLKIAIKSSEESIARLNGICALPDRTFEFISSESEEREAMVIELYGIIDAVRRRISEMAGRYRWLGDDDD